MGPAGFLTLGTEEVRSTVWIGPRGSLDKTEGQYAKDQGAVWIGPKGSFGWTNGSLDRIRAVWIGLRGSPNNIEGHSR